MSAIAEESRRTLLQNSTGGQYLVREWARFEMMDGAVMSKLRRVLLDRSESLSRWFDQRKEYAAVERLLE